MDPEWPFAEGRIHHLDDCFRDRRSVGIGRHNGTECFQYLLAKALIGARFVFGDAGFICGPARMGKVIGATGECAGNDDGGFDAQPTYRRIIPRCGSVP
jgi:hypothetical protein